MDLRAGRQLQSRPQPRCIPAYAICIRAMLPARICDAAAEGDHEVVAAWLDENPESVNEVSNHGESLLLICLENGDIQDAHLESVRHLLSRGADPNQTCYILDIDTRGCMTPLFSICSSDCPHAPEIVACLLGAGADPNLRIADHLDQNGEPSSTFEEDSTPIIGAVRFFLGTSDRTEGSWHLPVVARLLRAGASLDNPDGQSADEWLADEERRWPDWAAGCRYFQAAKALIHGVRAAGSWKKYCRARAPHREILALRSLAMRGYITPYQRRRTRGAEHKIAIAFVARLGDNGIVWNILSFWRDADDVEAITLENGDVVRVYE